jgi:hypothetical protein
MHVLAAASLLVAFPPLLRPCPLRCQPLAASATGGGGDGLLVEATEALRASELSRAAALLCAAREAYEVADGLTSERKQLLEMVQSRINKAAPPPADEPAELAERPGGSAARQAVAAKLAAKLGPVAFAPLATSKVAKEATRRGDAAVSETISALGRKDFLAAYEAIEEARSAFRRAGSEVEEARAMTIDNLYGYIRAEMERNERLQRLVSPPPSWARTPQEAASGRREHLTAPPCAQQVRMKQILEKKKALSRRPDADANAE